jgi:16S rRNA (adenine1518-N6/adenine1519-N6)-dimethyltransferase
MSIRPKKALGQHFLTDNNIAEKIVSAIPAEPKTLVEIGPGTGMLSKLILECDQYDPLFIETDRDAIEYLEFTYPAIKGKLIHADILKADLKNIIHDRYQIVGNLPYNISSQIFFRMLEDRQRVQSAVVMIQKEVAERISTGPGSKTYGILSVLLQTWFNIEYLFTVSENVFYPPPKVKSAVIRLTRNDTVDIGCDPDFYFKVVKAGFNQRRKTLRNALKPVLGNTDVSTLEEVLSKRAEQLSVAQFVDLATFLCVEC